MDYILNTIILNQMQLKEEENIVNPTSNIFSPPSQDSHNTTIHALLPKDRNTIGYSNHRSVSRRKVIDLKHQSNEELPVLGHKLCHNQTHRMYESVIISNEPQLKRVKMSQITNLSQSKYSAKKKATCTYYKPITVCVAGMKRIKREGYAKQKVRLTQSENRLTQFLSNYQRVKVEHKLKDVMLNLREEVIRTNSARFALLSKKTE